MAANTIQPNTTGTYTLNAGDTLTVSSGGLSSQSVVNTSATEVINALGSGTGDVLSGGTEIILGTESGGVLVTGAVGVNSAGQLLAETQSGGSIFVNGGAVSSLTMLGGNAFVSSGSILSGGTVSGGTLYLSGGAASGTTVAPGGTEQIGVSGSDTGGVVAGTQYVSAGAQAVSDVVLAGGSQTVAAGGTAIGTIVAGSLVLSGGAATGATVTNGGTLTGAAGTASGLTVSSGGVASFIAGAVVSGATIAAGGELSLQGGSAIGSIANTGDVTFTFGTSNTFTGALSGTGTVTIGGQATVVLAGTDTGTGVTTIGYAGSLELTSAGAAGTGAIAFAAGTGTLILDGGAPTNVITGVLNFGSDKILLKNLGSATATISQAGDLVTVTGGGVMDTLNIAGSGTSNFTGTTSAGGFTLTEVAACFLRGGLIAVPGGEVAVETLQAGDLVLLDNGQAVPVRWVGTGSGVITDANRCDLAPVIVRAGALADGVPRRDLRLTRRHGVRVGDGLVPVELLVNDRSVVWDDAADAVEIYHIQIDGHGILLADGAPAESFRDDGSAGLFANAAGCLILASAVEPCLPVVLAGPALDQAWAAIAARVTPEGTHQETPAVTTDPDLHLEQDGARIPAFAVEGNVHRFRLPRPAGDIVLRSRSVIPASLGGQDARRLGVALTGLETGGVRHSPELLRHGVHGMEGGHRWTKGRTVLPHALFAGAEEEVELAVHLSASLSYRAPLAGVNLPG